MRPQDGLHRVQDTLALGSGERARERGALKGYGWTPGERWEKETPNPKHQAPEKSQTSNSKTCRRLAALEPGNFFGVWRLVFGDLIGYRDFPSPHSFVAGRGRTGTAAEILSVGFYRADCPL